MEVDMTNDGVIPLTSTTSPPATYFRALASFAKNPQYT